MSETTPTEEWRRIPGFPDYEVSNLGRVVSYRRSKPRLLSLCGWNPRYKKPYLHVSIVDEAGRARSVLVHKLVMLAFVGPRPVGMEILHRNSDGGDNRLTNLRYGTSAENAADTISLGRMGRRRKLTPEQWAEVRSLRSAGATYVDIARRYGVDEKSIRNIVLGPGGRRHAA